MTWILLKIRLLIAAIVFSTIAFSQLDNTHLTDSLADVLTNLEGKQRIPILKKLMRIQAGNYNWDASYEAASEALELTNLHGLDNERVEIYLFLSGFYKGEDEKLQIEFAEKALNLSRKIKYKGNSGDLLFNLGVALTYVNGDTAKIVFNQALDYFDEHNNDTSLADVYNYLGIIDYLNINYPEALKNWEKSLEIYTQIADTSNIGQLMSNISAIYRRWSEYPKAIEYLQKVLEINEQIGDKRILGRTYANLANIHYDAKTEDWDLCMEYYQKARENFLSVPDPRSSDSLLASQIELSISYVLFEKGEFTQAEATANKCLTQFIESNSVPNIVESYQHLGNIFIAKHDYVTAREYLEKALEYNLQINNDRNTSDIYLGLGEAYYYEGACKKAINYLEMGLDIAFSLGLKSDVLSFYNKLSQSYECGGNMKQALEFHKLFTNVKDSLYTQDNLEILNRQRTLLKTAEHEAEILRQEGEIKAKEAEIQRSRLIILFVSLGIIAVTVFIIISLRQTKRIKEVNSKLHEKNEEITHQRDQIQEQSQEIKASINYARNIQRASLPPTELFDKLFDDYFIFFRPRDIVSGDFYWCAEVGDKIVVTAADCTGHGVPGAFMSMMGMSLLNEIVTRSEILVAGEILNRLKDNIIKALHQKGGIGSIHDGMDMALCVIDKTNQQLQFAGAYNPLVRVTEGELVSYKATRRPVSYYERKDVEFENNIIDYKKGDCIYMFSDGYPDQFGGPKRKKFMSKKFNNTLLEYSSLDMENQKARLDEAFDSWKGDFDQVDDVLVIGIRL